MDFVDFVLGEHDNLDTMIEGLDTDALSKILRQRKPGTHLRMSIEESPQWHKDKMIRFFHGPVISYIQRGYMQDYGAVLSKGQIKKKLKEDFGIYDKDGSSLSLSMYTRNEMKDFLYRVKAYLMDEFHIDISEYDAK